MTITSDVQTDKDVVYKGYTRDELNESFKHMTNPDDWKAEIAAVMPGECVHLAVAAIEFFTATTPVVLLKSETMMYYVYSIGYRAGPAGDH